MSGEIMIAFGAGGMFASLLVLALCKSAGDTDTWLATHQPSEDLSQGNDRQGNDIPDPTGKDFIPHSSAVYSPAQIPARGQLVRTLRKV